MTLKNFATAVILLFVTASIAAPIVRRVRHATTEAGAETTGLRPDRVAVYYFHGKIRCPECRTIESCARQTVEQKFPEQLRQGRIEWRVIDYQSPGNEHFVDDYRLIAATVGLVEFHDGIAKQWKQLARAWDFVGNRDEMKRYIETEIRSYLEEQP